MKGNIDDEDNDDEKELTEMSTFTFFPDPTPDVKGDIYLLWVKYGFGDGMSDDEYVFDGVYASKEDMDKHIKLNLTDPYDDMNVSIQTKWRKFAATEEAG